MECGFVIAAVSDVHSPRFLSLLREALSSWNEGDPCVLILAGDIVDRGRAPMVEPVVAMVKRRFPGARLVAVFGNEEYEQSRPILKRLAPEVAWLDDEVLYIECEGATLGIVGTQGALERPTRWQARNKPWLYRVYRERPRKIAGLLREARGGADYVILASHYGLARATLAGEDPRIWPYLYSSLMEEVIKKEKPDVAIHGHAHKGTPRAVVGGVHVYNVALPLNKKVVPVRLCR